MKLKKVKNTEIVNSLNLGTELLDMTLQKYKTKLYLELENIMLVLYLIKEYSKKNR